MKNLTNIILIAFALIIIACGGDDSMAESITCTQEDFLGSYSGTEQCAEETPDFMILIKEVTQGNSDSEVIYEGRTLVITDCIAEVSFIDSMSNGERTVTLQPLPGDSIFILESLLIEGWGFPLECRYYGTK